MVSLRSKTCKKCGVTKDACLFYENNHNVDHMHSWCISCCKVYAKQTYQARKEGVNEPPRQELPPELKHCPKCEKDLPTSEFSKSPNGKHGRQSWCKSCFKRRYFEKYHPERMLELDDPDPYAELSKLDPYAIEF